MSTNLIYTPYRGLRQFILIIWGLSNNFIKKWRKWIKRPIIYYIDGISHRIFKY